MYRKFIRNHSNSKNQINHSLDNLFDNGIPRKIQRRVGLVVTIFSFRRRLFTPIPNACVPTKIMLVSKNAPHCFQATLLHFASFRYVNSTSLAHSAGSLSATIFTLRNGTHAAAQSHRTRLCKGSSKPALLQYGG